jgi:hypothetical protein
MPTDTTRRDGGRRGRRLWSYFLNAHKILFLLFS